MCDSERQPDRQRHSQWQTVWGRERETDSETDRATTCRWTTSSKCSKKFWNSSISATGLQVCMWLIRRQVSHMSRVFWAAATNSSLLYLPLILSRHWADRRLPHNNSNSLFFWKLKQPASLKIKQSALGFQRTISLPWAADDSVPGVSSCSRPVWPRSDCAVSEADSSLQQSPVHRTLQSITLFQVFTSHL